MLNPTVTKTIFHLKFVLWTDLTAKLLSKITKTELKKATLRHKRNISSSPIKKDPVKRGALNLIMQGHTLSLPLPNLSFEKKKNPPAKKLMWCSLLHLCGSRVGSAEREAGLLRWWVMSWSAVTSWRCSSAHLASLPSRLCSFLLYHRSEDTVGSSQILPSFPHSRALTPIFSVMRPTALATLINLNKKEVWLSPSRLQNRVWNLPFIPRHDFSQFLPFPGTFPPSSYNSCHLLSVQSILLKKKNKTEKQKNKTLHFTKLKGLSVKGERMRNQVSVFFFRGKRGLTLILLSWDPERTHLQVGWLGLGLQSARDDRKQPTGPHWEVVYPWSYWHMH